MVRTKLPFAKINVFQRGKQGGSTFVIVKSWGKTKRGFFGANTPSWATAMRKNTWRKAGKFMGWKS